jgi:hypothetical protein
MKKPKFGTTDFVAEVNRIESENLSKALPEETEDPVIFTPSEALQEAVAEEPIAVGVDLSPAPYVGLQVWFVKHVYSAPSVADGVVGGAISGLPQSFVAWVDHVREDQQYNDKPLVDLTYHSRDERGAVFASMIPYDPEGQKDHSWNFRGEGK